MKAWNQELEPSASPTLLVARGDNEILGVLPIALLNRDVHRHIRVPLSYLGIAGSGRGAADHVGPLTDSVAVGALLLQHLSTMASGTLYLENLSPRWGSVAAAVTGGHVISETSCPVNTRGPSGSFQDSWSSKTKKNARRRARMLEREGIVPRWIGPGPDFNLALQKLRALHDSRWQARGEAGLFPDEREKFLASFAGNCTPSEGPWILLMERGHETVAALFGIRFRDSFSVYKTGWSPTEAKLGPGVALGQEAMRWAEEQGLHTFDYLRGPGSHKAQLGCVPREDLSVLRRSGTTGQLLTLRERGLRTVRTAAYGSERMENPE